MYQNIEAVEYDRLAFYYFANFITVSHWLYSEYGWNRGDVGLLRCWNRGDVGLLRCWNRGDVGLLRNLNILRFHSYPFCL